MQKLRQIRQFLMLKWIWQDALGEIELEQLMGELSGFADACIKLVHRYAYDEMVGRYGIPKTQINGVMCDDELAVIAMGKLGARELNLSSDIDLIFVHLGVGETDVSRFGKKIIDNQKFMINMGRVIIKMLDEITQDGFVFRVDMRLRPWGDGSPLVMTVSALEKYFNQHGRTWERFAWLKGRVVNVIGDDFKERLTQICKNFIYRYYVDYSAFGALREMKAMIVSQQTQRQDLDNVKLGVGGIRDIEFIVQSFALIYGGHDVVLSQKTACLDTLPILVQLGHLTAQEGQELGDAYRFLRRLEHAIQARHDQQTQRLPTGDELAALASVMGFGDVSAFTKQLSLHRQRVSVPFERMITDRQSPKQPVISEQDIRQNLMALGVDLSCLDEFLATKMVVNLEEEPKNRLHKALPILLQAVFEYAKEQGEQAQLALPRLVALLESVCRRSIYLVMMAENPNATIALIPMLASSPWIAKELVWHPVLLDNFLHKRYLHLPSKNELADILRQNLLRVERFDDENYLAAIRLFKKTQVLAVASADVLELRHIMKVSDSLTFIAQVVLNSALQRAYDELTHKHGKPQLNDGRRADDGLSGFAIIGYGKLGGIEMSYASDLDVVFLHDINEQADTDGAKPISGMKFASRLVQKILSYLTTQTRDGRAYEMDMRLRPSGNAGVMVVSVSAFDKYQHEKAWAWEHQALVRARGIAGDEQLLVRFEKIRQAVLMQSRCIQQVRSDVIEMRHKMHDHLGTKDGGNQEHQFDIKQDFGGLVDIEFLAQFIVLSQAHQYPNLAIWSDNVRIFEEVAKTGLWSQERCQRLTDAYLQLRKRTHELALLEQKVIVYDDDWRQTREFVQSVWRDVMGGDESLNRS